MERPHSLAENRFRREPHMAEFDHVYPPNAAHFSRRRTTFGAGGAQPSASYEAYAALYERASATPRRLLRTRGQASLRGQKAPTRVAPNWQPPVRQVVSPRHKSSQHNCLRRARPRVDAPTSGDHLGKAPSLARYACSVPRARCAELSRFAQRVEIFGIPAQANRCRHLHRGGHGWPDAAIRDAACRPPSARSHSVNLSALSGRGVAAKSTTPLA